MKIALIEDNKTDMERLSTMLRQFAADEKEKFDIREFINPVVFLEGYRADYDMVFMDIELPMIDGITAAQKLRKRDSEVIIFFLTNMAQLAIRGYEVSALDFMIKPVTYPQLRLKLYRAMGILRQKTATNIMLHTGNEMQRIATSEILYVEVLGHHISYHTITGVYEAYGKLSDALKQLPDTSFFQCHRCYIINLHYVSKVTKNTAVIGGDEISVSRGRWKQFMEALSKYLGGQ